MWQLIFYVTPLTVATFIALSAALSAAFAAWSARQPDHAYKAATVLFVLLLLFILAATLIPTQAIGSGDHTTSLRPGEGLLDGGRGMLPEERRMAVRLQIANAAMFLPLGALGTFLARTIPTWIAFGTCTAFSVIIETGQFLMNVGRVVDIDDVLLNSLGGGIGCLLARAAMTIISPRRGPGRPRHTRTSARAGLSRDA
ncbi:VanZ family protein [Streptomyces sp. NPDC001941]|uniref:VanZ family protein n=1 Tax=Streptomyces sp. NPDC001941 TaxID=3154659 RepID=UPI0033254879